MDIILITLNKRFKDKRWNVDECIRGIKEHPTVDCIYEVEYRLTVLNNKVEFITEQYKKCF